MWVRHTEHGGDIMKRSGKTRVSAVSLSAFTLLATGAVLYAPPAGAAAGPAQLDAATADTLAVAAEQSLEHRAAAIVETPTTAAATSPTSLAGGRVAVDGGQQAREGTMAAAIRTHRGWLRSVGEAFTGADTTLTVERVVRSGGVVTVDANETTMLAYAKIRGDEPPETGYTARHTFVFRQNPSGRWQLMEDRQLEPTGLLPLRTAESFVHRAAGTAGALPATPTAQAPAVAGETPAATARPAVIPAPKGSEMTAMAYNYGAMAAYLERYWQNYNPAYRSFNNVGGDCTNFASQALRAGGWSHDLGWYRSSENWWYNSSNETWSWINVNSWASFAYTHSRRVTSLSNVWHMGIGDVLQVDGARDGSKDHTMMVSYVSGGTPYLTYHSHSRYRRSMNQVLADWGSATYYAGRT
jgi:hypothetical protein